MISDNDKPLFYICNEGTMEEAIKMVHKAMTRKNKMPVNLNFFITTEFLNRCFLEGLAQYLHVKKAKKVDHVSIDIFIEDQT